MMRYFVIFLTVLNLLYGQRTSAETRVTTYIVKTQEERESTRWTLTEWLRIKERMKMMDVWLAMFSDPQKDKFSPELNLSYGAHLGQLDLAAENGTSASNGIRSQALKGQLWLTNILTGTVGVRSLNIDFGLEAASKSSTNLSSKEESAAAASDDYERMHNTGYGSANLRIFGKNIQDSSLVLKYGKYSLRDSTLGQVETTGLNLNKDAVTVKEDGVMKGAELQLYILKFLGAEGSYHAFGETGGSNTGHYFEYLGFVEISFIRLMVGRYQENWTLKRPVDQKSFDSKESGIFTGVKLQF